MKQSYSTYVDFTNLICFESGEIFFIYGELFYIRRIQIRSARQHKMVLSRFTKTEKYTERLMVSLALHQKGSLSESMKTDLYIPFHLHIPTGATIA